VQDGRTYIELINGPSLYQFKGSPAAMPDRCRRSRPHPHAGGEIAMRPAQRRCALFIQPSLRSVGIATCRRAAWHVSRPNQARQRGAARPAAMEIWSSHVHGRPQGGDDRGNAADLVDAKARFKNAWTRIRASLTDQDIADAQQIAAASAEALARYDRRHRRLTEPVTLEKAMPEVACSTE
jgi:hypothetical protein